LPSMVLNFLAKMKYLLKDSIFVLYIIALSTRFVKSVKVSIVKNSCFFTRKPGENCIACKSLPFPGKKEKGIVFFTVLKYDNISK